MITLEKYLQIDKKKQRYDLPFTFWENLKFLFLKTFLEFIPFKNKVFVDSRLESIYWEIIEKFLNTKYNVNFHKINKYFNGFFLHYESNVLSADKDNFSRGHGPDLHDQEISLSKAIGEFLERQLMRGLECSQNLFKYRKYKELGDAVVLISKYHNFSNSQKVEKNYLGIKNNEDLLLKSVKVEDLNKNQMVYYPAQSIFIRSSELIEKEGVICEITTSGCGAGFTIEMASLAGLYEAMERDSFFCYWLTKNVPDKIILESNIIVEYDNLKRILEISNYDLFILNTTTNLNIPTVVCVTVDRQSKGICLSGGSGLNFKKAISSAVLEMYSCLGILHNKKEKFYFIDEEKYKPFKMLTLGREERLNFWNHGKYFEDFNFFISGKEVDFKEISNNDIYIDSQKKEWEYILNKVKNFGNGYENVYRYLANDGVLKKLNYFVCRILIPKLYPLYLTEGYALTDSVRLREFNKWKTGNVNFEINKYPHPFP